MTDQTPAPGDPLAGKPTRIWVLHCPFKKNGAPSVGNFGATVRPIVIVPLETWTRLCKEIPELGTRQFEVGAEK